MTDRKKKLSADGSGVKRVTLNDVAAAVGCSKSTVSCALLGSQPLREATRKKVFAAVERLGYRPYCRRAEGRLRKRCVAVILNAGGISGAADRIGEALYRRGYVAQFYLLPRGNPSASFIRDVLTALRHERMLAGVLSLHSDLESADLLRRTGELPVEIFNRKDSMLSTVYVDYSEIGALAGKHLALLRHPKAAFIANDDGPVMGTMERLDLLCQGIRTQPDFLRSGAELRMVCDPPDSGDKESFTLFDRLREEGFTAFLVSGSGEYRKFLRWCGKRRWRIPEELSVLLLDHGRENETALRPASSISVPYDALVDYSVAQLIAKIEARPTERHAFLPVYVDCGTTAVCDDAAVCLPGSAHQRPAGHLL